MVVKHLKLHLKYFKLLLSSAMEYRFNFLTQITSMILNNIVWIIFWSIFFGNFNTINGWQLKDIMIMFGIASLSYGLTGFFFGNRTAIAEKIAYGKLDFYLTLPKNVLYHLLFSGMRIAAIGDIIFGIFILFYVLPILKIPLALFFVINSAVIFTGFCILIGSLAFFMGNSESISKNAIMSVLTFATYPFSIFDGLAKFILLSLIPAGFISGVPIELLKSFNIYWFLGCIAFSLGLLALSIFVFKKGLKRYESGNLLYVRM